MGGDYSTGGRAGIGKGRRIGIPHLRLVLVLVGVALVLAYLFIRSAARLADNPPAEFTNPRAEWDAPRKELERQLALAYWQRAKIDVQYDFLYGSELPEQPPEGFKIDTSQFRGMPAAVAESRARYWRRLRRVWSRPQSWQTSYEWNTEWVTKVLDAVFH
jgi:hypothetical protein